MGIYQLKEEGHRLIDHLHSLGMKVNGHRGIYSVLRRRLHVASGKEHFSQMNQEYEVINAINELREMVIILEGRVKSKAQYRLSNKEREEHNIIPKLKDEILPRAQRIKAMEELAEYKRRLGPFFINTGTRTWTVGITH